MVARRETPNKTVTPAGRSREIRGVVMHHTGTTHVVQCAYSGSWHYIIDRDGTAYGDIDERDIAWHTASTDRWRPSWVSHVAPWFTGSDINTCTIGIELVSHPDLPDFAGYTDPQLRSLYALFDIFKETYGDLDYVGHGQVQSNRRLKEPEHFDWEGFEETPDGRRYLFNPYTSGVSHDEEGQMTEEQQQILDACERHELKGADDIDQLMGRYDLLAQQVESLEALLTQAQAERDAALGQVPPD